MDAVFNRAELKRVLTPLGSVIPKATTVDAFQCVLFEADQTQVRLTTTDGEMALCSHVGADISKPGRLLIPFVQLVDLLGTNREAVVQIKKTRGRNRAAVIMGRSQSTLKGEDPDTAMRVDFGEHVIGQMDADAFRRALGWASSCASRTTDRPLLETVYIESRDGHTHFVGTDGYRMAVSKLPGQFFPEGQQFLVPNRALVRVWRFYKSLNLKDDDVVYFYASGAGAVTFRFPGVMVSHRLFSAMPYVDYEHIVPKGWNMRLVLKLDDFVNALKVIRVLAKRRGDFNKTVFQVFGGDTPILKLFTYVEQEAELAHTILLDGLDLADGVETEYLVFVLNSYWTLKALDNFSGDVDQVAVEVVGPGSPFIFRPVGDTIWEDSYSFQMPMADDAVVAYAEDQRSADERLADATLGADNAD